MCNKPCIQFSNFSFRYHNLENYSLNDINLGIYAGEKILVTGRSGSGKSTLLHAINGIIPFASYGHIEGNLEINGVNSEKDGIFTRSKIIGTIMQDQDSQFIGLTVGEDVAFSLENDGINFSEMNARVKESLTLVTMLDFIDHSPYELSGGQKQRVSLAGILASSPETLIFDEPLANLDPASGVKVTQLIREINHQTGKTILIAEHRIEECLELEPDRIVVMDSGKIVAIGKPYEILSSGIFEQLGIRLPLYVEALKYSGLDKLITKISSYGDVEALDIDELTPLENWAKTISLDRGIIKHDNLPVLSVEHLSFGYESDQQVLADINFKLCAGEIVSLLGNNGAGKSTLTYLISGIYKPDEGAIFLNNIDITSWKIMERGSKIALIMQNPNQMIVKSVVWDEVALGLLGQQLPDEEVATRVEKSLRTCELWGYRNWPVTALSYGQKKRVTIAAMLVLNPQLLILDEPTAGQDLQTYNEFMGFIRKLADRGIAILIITHDLYLAIEYTDRSIVIANGQLIADTVPAQIFANQDLLRKASLRELSLSLLARKIGVNPMPFIQQFINCKQINHA